MRLIVLLLLSSIFLLGCEEAKRLPGTPDDDDAIVSSQAVKQVLWRGVTQGVRNGRMSWRSPASLMSKLPYNFQVCFPGDRCYPGKKGEIYRNDNGVAILTSTPKRKVSTGGLYIQAKYGYRGKIIYVTR